MMSLICIALLLLTILLLAILERERRNKCRKFPPGPWGLPIVGYLPWLDPKEPHESLTSLTKKYGRVCALKMGSVYTVLISDPRIVRQAFAKSAISGRAPLHLTHGIMQGYGLICAEGDHWKEQRKFVTTCLKNFGMVKYGDRRDKMESDITQFVDQAINALKKESVEGAIDASKILHHYLGNFMNNLVFGKVYEEDDETWKWLRHIQEEGVKYLGIAGPLNFLPFLRFIPRFNKVTRILVDGQAKTHREYARMIEEHRAYKNSREAGTEAENFLKSFDDEVSKRTLIGDLGSFTERQYHFLLADLFGAGVDTTFTSLRWFLLYMAVHPQEQENIHREMNEVLGNRAPKLEDRSQLLYLEASILEVQRIRSVVPVGIPHGTTEDTTIGDFDIPKGTMVVPLQWAIHMDPEYWDDPNSFKPERFIAEDGNLLKPEAFLPFQNGKRMCPGDELAKMLLFIFAGRILFSFTISAPPEGVSLVGDCGITLVPKPHRLVFVPRQS